MSKAKKQINSRKRVVWLKNKIEIINNIEVENLYNDIKLLVEESKRKVYKMVNTEMINLYWSIGKMIVDKQGEAEKAKYKDYIIQELSIREIGEKYKISRMMLQRYERIGLIHSTNRDKYGHLYYNNIMCQFLIGKVQLCYRLLVIRRVKRQ